MDAPTQSTAPVSSTSAAAPAATPAARFRLPLYGLEMFTLVNVILTLILLRSRGLRIDWRTFEYIVGPLFKSLPFFLLVGIAFATLVNLLTRQPLKLMFRKMASWRWFSEWARVWAAILITTYSYAWLKVNVPILNQQSWDQEFWQLDTFMHLGLSPSIFAVELFKDSFLLGWMDVWYDIWKQTVIFSLCCFTVLYEGDRRRNFTFVAVLIWTLGAWLYVAFPAVGPIYVFTDHWREVLGSMPMALATQSVLWDNYQILLAGLQGQQIHGFNPTRGVAAMPSLHVAMHCFLALWCWRYLRPLFVVFFVATILTFAGSILTGWHYAIDGYIGLALATFSFWVATRNDRGEEGPPEDCPGEDLTQTTADSRMPEPLVDGPEPSTGGCSTL